MRRRLLTAPLPDTDRDGMLIDYWTTLHTMGHLLTIASSPAARPWLLEMASCVHLEGVDALIRSFPGENAVAHVRRGKVGHRLR